MPVPNTINRRTFLRFAGFAAAGLFISPTINWSNQEQRFKKLPASLVNDLKIAALEMKKKNIFHAAGLLENTTYSQGRICEDYADVYNFPQFDATRTAVYWKDSIIPITGIAISEDTSSHNLVWFKIGDIGYIHSGVVQPVQTILNEVNKDIPEGGRLAEVTVPYTDAYRAPNKNDQVVYRFYFETTHWVTGIYQDDSGNYWYGVFDDKYKGTYYVQSQHIRLVSNRDVSQISPLIPNSLKKIKVFLESQILVAYEQDRPVFFSRAATGGIFSTGTYTTPTGNFQTFHKRPSRHMAAGDIASNGYDLPGVPWISYITPSGIAIHGTYWHNNFGKPRSHGCINLSSQASKWIYRWTNPTVPYIDQVIYEFSGTLVQVVE